jgi:hypothetical protein
MLRRTINYKAFIDAERGHEAADASNPCMPLGAGRVARWQGCNRVGWRFLCPEVLRKSFATPESGKIAGRDVI